MNEDSSPTVIRSQRLGASSFWDSAICLDDERAEPTNSSWPGTFAHASLTVTEHEPSLVASSAVCVSVGLRRSGAGIRAAPAMTWSRRAPNGTPLTADSSVVRLGHARTPPQKAQLCEPERPAHP